ncbi:MAG: hypothetical protein AB7V53_06580 [Dongiaceae bacterium]
MRVCTCLCLPALLVLLGGCARDYVPVVNSTMLVAPMTWYDGRMSRPVACSPDRVYFPSGSAEITPEIAACLRTKIPLMNVDSFWLVVGSADHQEAATERERIELMRRRAENVLAFFKTYANYSGKDSGAITSVGSYLNRSPSMSPADYHQEFRIVAIR